MISHHHQLASLHVRFPQPHLPGTASSAIFTASSALGAFLGVFLNICYKRCCFISNLRHALCRCLILGHYCCLCHRCGCQNNRVRQTVSLLPPALSPPAGAAGAAQTLDHLIQLSACLIQAVQNLLQSIFCILFVLFSHGQLSFQFLQKLQGYWFCYSSESSSLPSAHLPCPVLLPPHPVLPLHPVTASDTFQSVPWHHLRIYDRLHPFG